MAETEKKTEDLQEAAHPMARSSAGRAKKTAAKEDATATTAKGSSGASTNKPASSKKATGTSKSNAARSTGAGGRSGTGSKKGATGGTKRTGTGAKSTTPARKKATEPLPPEEPTLGDLEIGREDAPQALPPAEPEKKSTLPIGADEHGVKNAVPPVDFPEEITRRGILTRVAIFAVVVVVLAVAAVIFFFRPVGYTEKIQSVQYFYVEAEDRTMILVNGEEEGTFSSRLAIEQTDGRGYTCLALSEAGELYLIRGTRVRLIAQNVADIAFATSGKTMAYRTVENVLYRQDTGKKDTPELISRGVTEDPFCLSPNGKELLYTSDIGGIAKMEIFSADGKAPYLTNMVAYRPVAVADGCAYLYFCTAENQLYIYEAKTEKMTDCGIFESGSLVFNRDLDEVFLRDTTRCRFYRGAQLLNFVGLSDGEALSLVPNQRVESREVLGGVQYLQSSLLNNYYTYHADGAVQLAYLTRSKTNIEIAKIHFVDGREVVTVTDKYVFFLSTDVTASDTHSNLFSVKAGKTEATRLMADVAEYLPNVDGSRILYRDVRGPLRTMRIGSAPLHLSDEIMPGTLCVTLDDVFFYQTPDGALYRSDNGGTPEGMADRVIAVESDAHVAVYTVQNEEYVQVYTNYRNHRKSEKVLDISLSK